MTNRLQSSAAGRRACGFALIFCLLATVSDMNPSAAAPRPRRPNVLVIVTDDQRRDTMSVMPNTRRWFRRTGVAYKSAWTPIPLCCPARSSIFTGQYAHNHLVRNNDEGQVNNLEQRNTLQFQLSRAGYRTGMVGKYLNFWDLNQAPPHFDKYSLSAGSNQYFDTTWNVDGELVSHHGYSTTFIKRRVAQFLREAERDEDARPWFLYVATRSPHGPATPEPRYEQARVPRWKGNPAVFESDRTDKPPHVQADVGKYWRARLHRKAQLRSLMSVDDFAEDVRLTLRKLSENRSTLVIFVSDNGEQWAEHGVSGKGVAYTGSIKVPMFARWPGRLPVGKDKRMVTLVDIAPTILDAANVRPNHVLDGRSLLDGSWSRKTLLFEYWNQLRRSDRPNWASLRTRQEQYTEYYDTDANTVEFREYYDLISDPWQLENTLADFNLDNDPNVARLSGVLDRYRGCKGSSCP